RAGGRRRHRRRRTDSGAPEPRLAATSERSPSRMNRRVSRLIGGWRTGLSRPVLILQGGNALNFFGYGLVLPFEIIYLHQIRGFSTSTAGLVLAATMGRPQSSPRRRVRCSTGTPPKCSWSQEAWRA